MIEPEDDLTATESDEDTAAAKTDMEDRTPEDHDPENDRGGGGAGGEAGAVPGMPASERTNEQGHEPETRAFAMKPTTHLGAGTRKVSGIAPADNVILPVGGGPCGG